MSGRILLQRLRRLLSRCPVARRSRGASRSVTSVQCPIDCEPFCSRDDIVATPCGHVFHRRCAGRWLQERSTCPICRQDVTAGQLTRLYLEISDAQLQRVQRDRAAMEGESNGAMSQLANSASPEALHRLELEEITLTEARDAQASILREMEQAQARQREAELYLSDALEQLEAEQLRSAHFERRLAETRRQEEEQALQLRREKEQVEAELLHCRASHHEAAVSLGEALEQLEAEQRKNADRSRCQSPGPDQADAEAPADDSDGDDRQLQRLRGELRQLKGELDQIRVKQRRMEADMRLSASLKQLEAKQWRSAEAGGSLKLPLAHQQQQQQQQRPVLRRTSMHEAAVVQRRAEQDAESAALRKLLLSLRRIKDELDQGKDKVEENASRKQTHRLRRELEINRRLDQAKAKRALKAPWPAGPRETTGSRQQLQQLLRAMREIKSDLDRAIVSPQTARPPTPPDHAQTPRRPDAGGDVEAADSDQPRKRHRDDDGDALRLRKAGWTD